MNDTYKQIVLAKYTECPYYGRPKLTAHLRQMGHHVNPKTGLHHYEEFGHFCDLYPSQNETGSGCLSKIIIVAACCASTLPGRTRQSRILPQPQA